MSAEILSTIPSLQLPLPSLEFLSILCTNSRSISHYSRLQLACNAPKLRDLTFTDVENPAGSFAIPWAQITHCNISHAYHPKENPGPDPDRFLRVLELMKNLTSCDLVCEAYSKGELEAERVACTKLQDFTLTSWPCYRDAIPQFFSRLLLPSLSAFKAKCSMGSIMPNHEDSFRSIRHAINVSQSPLTTFEFENGLIAEEDLLSILRTTPTLEFLKLVDVGPHAITDQTLDELMVRPNKDFIMPRLSSLHLSAEMEFTSQKFVAMVESRQKGLLGVDHLKSVNICWVTDEDDLNENEASGVTILSALDTYRLEGLEFILTTQKKPAQDSEDETED
ncbi:hypothetical protein EDD85DRAFT_392152 [Armillaria nabsnona]|nr:hypothetical protein EDD85DRAFT_392152 [Armillaria nabsnona]